MDLADITAYLHKHIPITAHLGASVDSYDGNTIALSAPLRPNLNHRNTVFGGSMSMLAILSGWTLLHVKLREEGIRCRLVIQKTSCDFLEPIDADFTSTSPMPDAAVWGRFLKTLKKHGKARITVRSEITSSSGTGGTQEGLYVAFILKQNESA
jgi:thioesterase domain-containing protein